MRAIFRHEENLIVEFFGDVKVGFFVDVGAADPRENSQSWPFEQAGWNGVLVEPRPDFAQKLRQQRRAKVYEVACTSPANVGSRQLNLRGGYSSLNDRMVIAGMRPLDAIEVRTMTLDAILADAQAPAPIDFISIDVEGHENEVLDGLDLPRWRPRLLLIEDHLLDLRLHRSMRRRGYKWVRRTGLNAWYVPVDSPMTVGWLGRLQFFRKHYLSLPARGIRDALRRVRTSLNVMPPRHD